MPLENHAKLPLCGPSQVVRSALDYNSKMGGKRWVAYFDRLGFGDYTRKSNLISVFHDTCVYLETARRESHFNQHAEFAWFSDTIIIYSSDDSKNSFRTVAQFSRFFFDELTIAGIPSRGAVTFGDFYGDKANSLFLGKALVEACEYGEKFNWLGFVLHPSALKRMAETDQPLSDLYYRRWNAEFKNRKNHTFEREDVVAYLMGPGSIMPVVGGNPYLEALEKMENSTDNEDHKRKYSNTIEFLKSFEPNP